MLRKYLKFLDTAKNTQRFVCKNFLNIFTIVSRAEQSNYKVLTDFLNQNSDFTLNRIL